MYILYGFHNSKLEDRIDRKNLKNYINNEIFSLKQKKNSAE